MRLRFGGITYRCIKNKNITGVTEGYCQTFCWIYFNKSKCKNVADNQLPFLEQASEKLLDINYQEVLDI